MNPLQHNPAKPSSTPTGGLAEGTDEELLMAIGQRRDEAAFNALYHRHEKRLFNLACQFVTPQEAQDVLQETMIQVWWACRNYRPQPGATALAYLARILIHEALKAKRSSRSRLRGERRVIDRRLQQGAAQEAAPEGTCQQAELAGRLASMLQALPDRDRQLAALYYAGGLTQTQIALALRLPQRTVSHRLRCLVQRLRTSLAPCGPAGLAEVEIEAALAKGFQEGPLPPEGLLSRIRARLGTPPETVLDAARSSLPLAATQSFRFLLVVAGAVAVAAAVSTSAGWLDLGENGLAPPSAPAAAPNGEALPRTASQAQANLDSGGINRRWNFKNGPAADLRLLRGSWRHLSEHGAAGMAFPPGGEGALIALPFRAPAPPLKLLFTGRFLDSSQRLFFRCNWASEKGFTPYRAWSYREASVSFPVQGSALLLEDAVIQVFGGRVFRVVILESGAPRDLVVLNFSNFLMESLEVRSLEADQVPHPYRSPLALIAASRLVEDPVYLPPTKP